MSENLPYFSPKFVAFWEKMKHKGGHEEEEQFIHVGRTMGAFGFFYERLRQVVDYQEDHLFRRLSLERIVKRLPLLGNDVSEQAEGVIRELIMARYLPNDAVPQSVVGRVAVVLQKYNALHSHLSQLEETESISQEEWVILLAREIDAVVSSSKNEDALVDFIAPMVEPQYGVTTDKALWVEAALRRLFFRLDEGSILWFLTRRLSPSFYKETMPIASSFEEYTAGVRRAKRLLDHLNYRHACRALRPLVGPAMLIPDLIKRAQGAADLNEKDKFHHILSLILSERFERAQTKRRRMVWRSLLYIIITKVFLMLLVEVPYEHLVYGHLRWLPLGINLAFPPIFLILVVSGLRAPKGKEIKKLEEALHTMMVAGQLPPNLLKTSVWRGTAAQKILFWCGYVIAFFAVFGGVALLLQYFKFEWPHYMVFYFFVCTVGYFGFRVRQAYREMVMGQEVDGMRGVIFDFLALPFIRVGRWLSQTISKLNIFVFILDIFIEAPFKLLLEWIESWFSFIRERRDDLIAKE